MKVIEVEGLTKKGKEVIEKFGNKWVVTVQNENLERIRIESIAGNHLTWISENKDKDFKIK